MIRTFIYASFLCAATAAQAAKPTYAINDLLLGFRKVGATQCYLVNIGQASQFTGATAPFTVNTGGSIAADLITVLGNNWATDSTVTWSVSGTTGTFNAVGTDPAKTLYATREEAVPGTQSTPWTIASSTNRATTTTRMSSMANTFVNYDVSASSTAAVIQGSDDANSYRNFQPGGTSSNTGGSPGISFGAFNPSIEGSFANGAAGSVLDLYRIPNTGTAAGFVGKFTITAAGVVTFTPPTAAIVPLEVAFFNYVPGLAQIGFKGNPGTNYTVQRSTSLTTGTWTNLATVQAAPGGTFAYSDSAAPAGRAFYRAIKP